MIKEINVDFFKRLYIVQLYVLVVLRGVLC